MVTAQRVTLPPLKSRATSALSGTFQISGIEAGEYRLCAQAPNNEYLDPCWWKDPFATLPIRIQAGRATAGVRLQVEPAVTMRIRIVDPKGDLGPGKPAHVMAGAKTAGGIFLPAVVKSHDAGGQILEAPVPPGRAVRLMIKAHNVALLDAVGRRVPGSGDTVSVTWSQDRQEPFTYTVSGVAP
jgi:hypothetical protein